MKGIRKLFFGLIFMTLIGVGFKIDVKAADPTLSFVKPGTAGTENWSAGDAELIVRLTGLDDSGYPTTGTEYDYVYKCDVKNGDKIIKTVNVEIKLVGSTRTVTVGGIDVPFANEIDIITTDTTKSSVSFPKSDVKNELNSISGTGEKSLNLTATATGTAPAIVDGTTTINMYQVDAKAYATKGTSVTELDASISGNEEWRLPGESVTLGLAEPDTSTYSFNKWTSGKASTSTSTEIEGGTSTSLTSSVTSEDGRYFKVWYTAKAHSITLSADENGTVTGPNGANKNEVIYLTATPNRGYSVDKWVSSDVTNIEETSTTQCRFIMPDKDVTVVVLFKKDGSSSGVDPIYVTKGKTVPLSKFITDETLLTNNISLKSGGYTAFADSATASSWSTTINKPGKSIYVLGNQVTDTREDITVNGSETDKVNVTVYPTPSVNVNSSGGAIVDSATGSSNSSGKSPFTVIMPTSVAYDNEKYDNINQAQYQVIGSRGSQGAILPLSTSSGSGPSSTKSREASWLTVAKLLDKTCEESDEWVTVRAYPVNPNSGQTDTNVSGNAQIKVYRIKLDSSEGAKYTVNGVDLGEIASGDHDYFYAVDGVSYTIVSSAKSTGTTLQRWDDDENNKSNTRTFTASSSKTYKAIYSSNTTTSSSRSSSSSSSTGRTTAAGGSGGSSGSGMDDYDDVPKTGESKADIWILWSVLFISILGAGFMIWKRFGLVKAIAEADEEVAYAEHEEMAEAKKQEKESKLKMLMDLRNLK